MTAYLRNLLLLLMLLPGINSSAQHGMAHTLRLADSLLQIEQLTGTDSLLRLAEFFNTKDETLQMEHRYLWGFYFNNTEDLSAAAGMVMDLPEKALQRKQYALAAKTYLLQALIYEKTPSLPDCRQKLDEALHLIQAHNLDSLYGRYYVRLSSYYRFAQQYDSALSAAGRAIVYAKKFGQQRTLTDGYLLTGILTNRIEPGQSIPWFQLALQNYLHQKNYVGAAAQYNNLSKKFLQVGNMEQALAYSDSALWLAGFSFTYAISTWQHRSEIYERNGQHDSALHYYKKYSKGAISVLQQKEAEELKKITSKYELSKKEGTIREQRNRFRAAMAFALLTGFAFIVVYSKNKKIKNRNQQINSQVIELNKLLQQKQILLSELQHRVKNNLQQVLSLMDIQKESLQHNNIQEVIRENRNRVHAMALLHSKLTFYDTGDAVNFEQFLHEMAALMKTAYYESGKKITVQVDCLCKPLPMDTALPLGMVVVELLSNGLKHAFKNRKWGIIKIDICFDERTAKQRLNYSDNGVGFEPQQYHNKGLGLELIHGFLRELNATFDLKQNNGTIITILF